MRAPVLLLLLQAAEGADRAEAAHLALAALARHRDTLGAKLAEEEEERRGELMPQIKVGAGLLRLHCFFTLVGSLVEVMTPFCDRVSAQVGPQEVT